MLDNGDDGREVVDLAARVVLVRMMNSRKVEHVSYSEYSYEQNLGIDLLLDLQLLGSDSSSRKAYEEFVIVDFEAAQRFLEESGLTTPTPLA